MFLLFSVLATFACVSAQNAQTEFVSTVRQNYQENINKMIVDQIRRELQASYIYQAYASYFQRADVSLPGIKKFFSDASVEERDHAQQFIDYVNKRGGHATFEKLELKETCEAVYNWALRDDNGLQNKEKELMCICGFVATGKIHQKCSAREQWKEGELAFKDALVLERYVNINLLNLHKEADKDSVHDAHLTHLLEHDFLDEQVHAIYKIANHLTRLQSFADQNYKLGEYIFDQNLQK